MTRVCIVVQRMAHHKRLVHLTYPDLSFVNLWWQKAPKALLEYLHPVAYYKTSIPKSLKF